MSTMEPVSRSNPLLAVVQPPVFLHSSFRTSSTWLWSKLRSAPTTIAYYEVFHEVAGALNAQVARDITYDTWQSKHPPTAPYFLEFLPLVKVGEPGLPGYDTEMAIQRFIPEDGIDGHLSASEIAYITSLVTHAQHQGRVPVLTDVRTLGRLNALKQSFDGIHIVLARNIFHQWASCVKQFHSGNSFFLDYIEKIITASCHDYTISMLNTILSPRKVDPKDENCFLMFIMFHIYLYTKTFDSTDLFVDVTTLETDHEMRIFIEERLSAFIGSPIDLSDVRCEFEFSLINIVKPQRFKDVVEQCTKQILASCPVPNPRRDMAIYDIKERALKEWERNEFYTQGMRSIYFKETADLGLKLESEIAERAAQLAQEAAVREAAVVAWNELQVQNNDASAQCKVLAEALNVATSECNASANTVSALEAQNRNLKCEMTESLNSVSVQLFEINTKYNESALALQALTDERDTLNARVTELTRKHALSKWIKKLFTLFH